MSLTMAQGMKRVGIPVAAFFGVALVGLIGTSWLLNRDALREAVEAQSVPSPGSSWSSTAAYRRLGISRQLRFVSRRRVEGRRTETPRSGRRADRQLAAAATAAAPLRDRRRHDAAAAYPCGPRRPRREQLDAVLETIARTMKPGAETRFVLGDPYPGRRPQLRG